MSYCRISHSISSLLKQALDLSEMNGLVVSLDKLERYCRAHGGYELEKEGDRLTLTFVPSFPEAQEKGDPDHPPPRVIMYGKVDSSGVHFHKVEVEDQKGAREKDLEESRMTYQSWLEFIEDNY